MIRKLKNLPGSIASVTALARDAGRNPMLGLLEYAYLRRVHGFTEHNISHYKLLSPKMPYSRKHEFMPSNPDRLHNFWRTLNPEEHEADTADKARFYRAAETFGLPVPRSYALISPDWATDWAGHDLGNRDQTLDYLRRQKLPSLVIKPAEGTQGRMTYLGTRCLDVDALLYADPFGTEFSVAAVLDHCLDRDAFAAEWLTTQRIPTSQVFIFQEYTDQTRAWAQWFGSKLAPLRLITLFDDNDVTIIAGYVSIYGSAIRTDEKILAPLDVETGEIGAGVQWKRPEWTPIHRLDDEHDVFHGATCLQWRELQQIATKAARAFPHSKAIAWDFVMTDDGPVILEGNTRWSVHSIQAPYARGILRGPLRRAFKKERKQKRNGQHA